jgi:inorganic pyrophosphatase
MRIPLAIMTFTALLFSACTSPEIPEKLYSENGQIQAVVEIPAGELDISEWDEDSESFVRKGQIDFLPFPGNYGFIPGTLHPENENGSGESLDVLVLSQREEVGAVLEIQPIAMLKLQRKGRFENKVIAVPVDEEKNPLDVKNYYEFQRDHYLCKNILMEWFLHIYRSDSVIFIGWENEKVATQEIERRKLF